jgi:hypothetical protein
MMKRAAALPTLLFAALAATSCTDEPAGLVRTKGLSFSVGQEPGTWAVLAPVPKMFTGVEGMSVSSVGNQIIAAFGFDNGDRRTTRIYDIDHDSWSFGADAPGTNAEGAAPISGASSAHGGLFYTIGGRRGFGGPPRAEIASYRPATNTWTVLTPMRTARAGLAAAQVGNALFAIGGRDSTKGPCSGNGTGELATVERYDIDTDTWTTVAPLPSRRSDLAAAAVGGKIYVFGGCRGRQNILGDVDVYDPVTNTWSTAPTDMPTKRAAMYAVENNGGTVYVIGGWDGVQPGLSTNEAYKVSQDQWTTGLPPMPTARAEAGAVGHNGKIYILGGAKPGFGASVDANEAFKP